MRIDIELRCTCASTRDHGAHREHRGARTVCSCRCSAAAWCWGCVLGGRDGAAGRRDWCVRLVHVCALAVAVLIDPRPPSRTLNAVTNAEAHKWIVVATNFDEQPAAEAAEATAPAQEEPAQDDAVVVATNYATGAVEMAEPEYADLSAEREGACARALRATGGSPCRCTVPLRRGARGGDVGRQAVGGDPGAQPRALGELGGGEQEARGDPWACGRHGEAFGGAEQGARTRHCTSRLCLTLRRCGAMAQALEQLQQQLEETRERREELKQRHEELQVTARPAPRLCG